MMELLFFTCGCIIALLSVYIFNLFFKISTLEGRFVTIDGIRGFLAFGVFLHHSLAWFFYVKTKVWGGFSVNYYNHLGQGSVLLFFMITGFLFFNKILTSSTIDWQAFYLSRFLRIYPLYIVVFAVVFIVSLFMGNSHVFSFVNLIAIFKWLIFASPSLNGFVDSKLVIAGVNWTLKYELFFYVFLPVLFFMLGKSKFFDIYLSLCVSALIFIAMGLKFIFLYPFICGCMASVLYVKGFRLQSKFIKNTFSTICIFLMCVQLYFFATAYNIISILIYGVIFIFLVLGSDFYGLFSLKISRVFGELTYSIYLIHGIILFLGFNFFIDKEVSLYNFWLLVYLMTVIVIFLSFLSFIYIERPCIKSANLVRNYVRKNWVWLFKR